MTPLNIKNKEGRIVKLLLIIGIIYVNKKKRG